MSRRLRLEELRLLQNKQEDEDEEDKLKLQKMRIFSPVLWARMGIGVVIQDLKEKHYEDALEMIKEHYLKEDVLCKNVEIYDDEESMKSFMDKALYMLKDSTSLVAVDEGSDVAVGALLVKVVHKSDFSQIFSRTIMTTGVAMKKIAAVETALNRKVDMFSQYSCESFLQIILLVIKLEYRRKGIGFQMMKCTFDEARSLKLPVVMGIFNSGDLQKKAKKLGMEVIEEIGYVEWRDKNGEMIFDDPGAGNYSVQMMVGTVPETKPVEAPPPPEPAKTEKKEKLTRADKRAKAAKKKQ